MQRPSWRVGAEVTDRQVGDEVCALLAGAATPTQVAVPAGQVMPVPAGVDLVTAAALPEVACTVWSNVFMIAALRPARPSSCTGAPAGSARCDPARRRQRRPVLTTVGTPEKPEFCRELGADVTISYRDEDFVEVVKATTRGADVILDNMGAKYLGRNVDALATEGRLVVIGMQGGIKGELDIATLLRKRGAVVATALRARPPADKAAICASVVEHVWPLVSDARVKPIVHTTMPLDQAAAAHALMESGDHSGKIVLTT